MFRAVFSPGSDLIRNPRLESILTVGKCGRMLFLGGCLSVCWWCPYNPSLQQTKLSVTRRACARRAPVIFAAETNVRWMKWGRESSIRSSWRTSTRHSDFGRSVCQMLKRGGRGIEKSRISRRRRLFRVPRFSAKRSSRLVGFYDVCLLWLLSGAATKWQTEW